MPDDESNSNSITDPTASDSDDPEPTTISFRTHRSRHLNMPLAEVKIGKLKDCPMLMPGTLTPLVIQGWGVACRRYGKFAKVAAADLVAEVADAMLEPRLVQWYQANQDTINAMKLDEYLKALADEVLDRRWAHKLREEILVSKQGTTKFSDWVVENQNKNAVLASMASTYALTTAALKAQLEASLNADLREDLASDPVEEDDFTKWIGLIRERDDKTRDQQKRIERAIADNNAARSQRRQDRSLASRLSSPAPTPSTSTSNAVSNQQRDRSTTSGRVDASGRPFLGALTLEQRRLLNEHQGCTRCRTFYAGHRSDTCPMTLNNTWPDLAALKPLTLQNALAAAPRTVVAAAYTGGSRGNDDEEEEFYDEDTEESD